MVSTEGVNRYSSTGTSYSQPRREVSRHVARPVRESLNQASSTPNRRIMGYLGDTMLVFV
jgi:hypothetical protein